MIHLIFKKFSFNDENITITSSEGQEIINWSQIQNWRKMGKYYALRQILKDFIVIPQKDIPTSNISDFEKLLSKKIGEKTSPPPSY